MMRVISSMFFGSGTTTCRCSSLNPSPRQMASNLLVPAESWPPVMPVVRLSLMMTVMLAFSLMASSSPVMPLWVKVESPMIATAGHCPASAAPFAIVMLAPMSTHEWMAWNGGRNPRV